ncbi:hypothetical protein Zm00014a_039988 [Zea mays]|uniref:Uncharacterized protein n=1 Tax=Zea mays TaxID=4577 RepID=A0A3L6EL48_MAIZE|nr:hypothetical protein Zm00014a_039988 [Zea mays]
MRLVGLVSLVAVIFLLSFRSLLHPQVLAGDGSAVTVTSRRRDRSQQHAEQWAEERKRMRWFMTRDYASARRHTPRNNRLDP